MRWAGKVACMGVNTKGRDQFGDLGIDGYIKHSIILAGSIKNREFLD
jgi:hypothetical protein